MDDLLTGILSPLLRRIKRDNTLMLSIRKEYINIYYRGGNIMRIVRKSNSYNVFFDDEYDLSKEKINSLRQNLPLVVNNISDIEIWISNIPTLKEMMDIWLTKHPKLEREFQQLVERENNRSSISNETEYFVTDIEITDASIGARFDITTIKWSASKRKDGRSCKPAFIEMKYADDALGGKSGLIKHMKDFSALINNTQNYRILLATILKQFNQLDQLGLIKINHGKTNSTPILEGNDIPEFIFLVANHNPRSKKLKSILQDPSFTKYINPSKFDLKFYVCSFAGYGLHDKNMFTYNEFIKLL
ncbi:MAG: hypothetical protein ACOYN6_04930 [Ignavibacteria bacterium]